ncbi:hypothetical protein [Actinomadura fibrosa]|uniref:RNA polymerase sigma-70 region 2 domain-containing protein n=1 Tax=Actinomadura fibrosa TaxID=111802 RepID=A0ABW2XQJ5_9ACTN|nr:hypothetical protein [Actinomadura fibrosa]
MPTHTAPPLNEDFRLVEELRAQRPGAVGHVYNVYGPELVTYAEGLTGEHERAVEAVRTGLLSLRARAEDVPDAGTFRDWLFEVVRDECRVPSARGRWRVALAGVAGAAVLTAGMLALFESTGVRTKPSSAPPVAVATPTPSGVPAEPPVQKDERDKPDKKVKKDPADRPEGGRAAASGRGRLAVDASGCQGIGVAGLPRTCAIRLTAAGGPVRWSVASVSSRGGRVSAAGGGTLAAGRSATVAVTVRPTVACYIGGGGGGTVSFSPGGTAAVSYTCWRR